MFPLDFNQTVKPINWKKNISMLEDGYRNEDLMVWMRTAAFPTFKKLYGRILIGENSELYRKISIPVGYNEEFFSNKDYNRTITNNQFDEIRTPKMYRLPKTQYFIDIDYRYMVKQISGKKYFILANVSWIGGKCDFLATCYIVVGVLCFMAAISLFLIHIYHGTM